MPILDHRGRPMDMSTFKKASPPKLGPAFADWAGRDSVLNQMPGASVLQFDLSRLTLADYRSMRYHPQVNASLSGLTFMMHQIDWHIECKDKKIAEKVERNLREIWTGLIRGLAQSFWAGFSPNVLDFENSTDDDSLDIRLKRVKDLYPEDCSPHWKLVKGAIPPKRGPDGQVIGPPDPNAVAPKYKKYDGITQWGSPGPIPVENTLWYPLLMQNGNYYGTQLLKAVFTPWYFSTLIHLFANRYYERFGEPTPIGRAPYDEEVEFTDGTSLGGRDFMDTILLNLRNRGVVNLPSYRDPVTKEFDYEIEYLESEMRGADFERYMSRLDEEISLGLFQPLLLMKTADQGGSSNLGIQHTQTWLWMLNAVSGDMAEYITVITERLKAINFSPLAPECRWVPNKMGKENVETVRAIAVEMIRGNKAKPDLVKMGEALGMDFEEIKEATPQNVEGDPNDPAAKPGSPSPVDDRQRTQRVRDKAPQSAGEPRAAVRQISHRLRGQVEAAFRKGALKTLKPDFGYQNRFETALVAEGMDGIVAHDRTMEFYTNMDNFVRQAIEQGADDFTSANDFMAIFDRKLDSMIEEIVD